MTSIPPKQTHKVNLVRFTDQSGYLVRATGSVAQIYVPVGVENPILLSGPPWQYFPIRRPNTPQVEEQCPPRTRLLRLRLRCCLDGEISLAPAYPFNAAKYRYIPNIDPGKGPQLDEAFLTGPYADRTMSTLLPFPRGCNVILGRRLFKRWQVDIQK